MLKKIKAFLFGKPTLESAIKFVPENYSPVRAPKPAAGDATKGNNATWGEAKEIANVLKAVAVQKEPIVEVETKLTVAPTTTKKKRTYTKRVPAVDTAPSTWPFPVEKPAEGVTPAELEALAAPVEPVKPAAMKVRKPRKAVVVPKQD